MSEETKKPAAKAAKAAKATVYVDVEDEITSIIDKMETTNQKVVALVLPKRASSLQSIVNMRLLKRSADNASKNVVLVTTEEALLPLAGAAGLNVADSLNAKPYLPAAPSGLGAPASKKATAKLELPAEETAAEGDEEADEDLPKKIDYKKSIGELAAVHEVDNPETIEIGDEENPAEAAAAATEKLPKAPKSSKVKVPNFDKFRIRLFAGIAGLIALIVLIILALVILPGATIAIETASTPVSANFNINTSGTAKSVTADTIPAANKTSDQSGTQTVAASGQQNTGNKATGSVTITNCSNSAVTVLAGSGVSGGGLTYITQKTLALDSGNFDSHGNCKTSGTHIGSVNVVAQQGGSKYNLSSGQTFSVSNQPSSVSGTNPSAFTGGTDNIQTVVSQSDVDSAVAKLKSSNANFGDNFATQLGTQGYYVFVSTLKAGDPVTTATPAVGQQATSTTVTIKITYSVLAVKKTDLATAINNVLRKQIDPTKEKINDADIISGASINVTNQTSPTVATLNISESTSAVPIINPNDIKKQAVGKKSGDISSAINALPGVKNVNVKFHPFWVSKAPKASKITVTLQHVNNTSGQ